MRYFQTRHAWLPESTTALPHDDDGQWGYLWDAENRLVKMETTQAAVHLGRPYRRLTFAYDWTDRRLARDIYAPNNTLLNATRWLYDGWNPIAEFSDQTTGQTLVRAYLWGMDMSGTMQGAGGVGGLLAVHIHHPPSTIYYPSYDGNGNITAWTQSGATAPACLREYDSFGNILVEHGTPPCAIGFSTKLEDPETGLLYYGYRYLSPPLGRWLSQDTIEEEGGLNLYGFVGNDGVGWWDVLGRKPEKPPCGLSYVERRKVGEARTMAVSEPGNPKGKSVLELQASVLSAEEQQGVMKFGPNDEMEHTEVSLDVTLEVRGVIEAQPERLAHQRNLRYTARCAGPPNARKCVVSCDQGDMGAAPGRGGDGALIGFHSNQYQDGGERKTISFGLGFHVWQSGCGTSKVKVRARGLGYYGGFGVLELDGKGGVRIRDGESTQERKAKDRGAPSVLKTGEFGYEVHATGSPGVSDIDYANHNQE